MVDSFYVVGSPERCRERIDEYRQAGVNLPLLLPRLEDFDQVARGMAVT
jgi:alkanesulfonate monooxygenase SsuD/methylene tetrahydromethanopterin reductase-like flavin-dependent oxidoreductase (luciferase family)